jgi:ribosomal protein S18 acetylase RimI-like enzyme
MVGPARNTGRPDTTDVERCLAGLRRRRVLQAVTPALNPFEAEPFRQAGFTVHEELHLLARPITDPLPRPGHPMRRGRPWDNRRVLALDAMAFEDFWRFDSAALKEAKRATPTHRFMVATDGNRPIGYAVTGRAGSRGYLQRLAVDPAAQGRGVGSSLVHDSLGWLQRKRADLALVNTQERNTRALALYQRLGFRRQPEGLLVLRWNEAPR